MIAGEVSKFGSGAIFSKEHGLNDAASRWFACRRCNDCAKHPTVVSM